MKKLISIKERVEDCPDIDGKMVLRNRALVSRWVHIEYKSGFYVVHFSADCRPDKAARITHHLMSYFSPVRIDAPFYFSWLDQKMHWGENAYRQWWKALENSIQRNAQGFVARAMEETQKG
jgi:hypothetical protein